MATKTFKVETYEVKLGRELSYQSGSFSAIIVCHGGDGFRMGVYFKTADSAEVTNISNIGAKWATIFLPSSLLPNYLNVLQNESPVYAYVNEDKPMWNQIYTGKEPVGEGET